MSINEVQITVMSTDSQEQIKQKLIKGTSFDYWLNSGYDPTKGDRQRLIDALPAITENIKNNIKLEWEDKKIIYDAMNFVDDILSLVENWDKKLVLYKRHFTEVELKQAETNKSTVQALGKRLLKLLSDLENECNSNSNYNGWSKLWKNIRRTFDIRTRKSVPPEKQTHLTDMHVLLTKLKDVAFFEKYTW